MQLDEMELKIRALEERNRRVEADKAWETSWARRLMIAVVTYVTAGMWLVLINDFYPWLKACIPAIGYLLSTVSLPVIQRWWMRRRPL